MKALEWGPHAQGGSGIEILCGCCVHGDAVTLLRGEGMDPDKGHALVKLLAAFRRAAKVYATGHIHPMFGQVLIESERGHH